jgi:hypothetical protein
MTRLKLRRWLGVSLLGFILALGCNQAQRRGGPSMRSAPAGSVVMMPAMPRAPVAVATSPIVEPVAPVAPEVVVKQTEPEPPPVDPESVHTRPINQETVQIGYANPLFGAKEEGVPRRSFADVTANPGFGHAPDYSWLTGELQYVHVRNSWRVRYASVDEEDRYGGSVTLAETGSMGDHKDGQMVRVEGHLLDPESRDPSPTYRVRNIQQLTP